MGRDCQARPCAPVLTQPSAGGLHFLGCETGSGAKAGSALRQSTGAEMPLWDKPRKSSMGELGLQPPRPSTGCSRCLHPLPPTSVNT